MKAQKGSGKVANGSSKKGLGGLKAKKPAMKSKKGSAVVANGSGSKGIGGLKKAVQKKGPAPKSKSEVAHAKRAVKLASYKF